MILDSSALIAVLLREPGHESLVERLGAARLAGVGAPTLVETGIVLTAKIGPRARSLLSHFAEEAGLMVIPFGEDHWRTAVEAYARFGRGRHPAALNYGDCMSYATARLAGQPLLCVGGDFAQTDIELA